MADKNPILEAVKRVPAQVAMGPADLLNLALGLVSGKGLKGVTPKSPSETINQDVLGLPEPELLSAQGATELAAGLINPAKAIAGVGKATALAVPMLAALMQKAPAALVKSIAKSQAGVIRPGGLAELNMFHATDLDALGRSEVFTDPSIAITYNRGNAFARPSQANLVLNPASPKFDPKSSGAFLINRDAFVDTAKADVRKSQQLDDLRLTQEQELPLQHALSILFSPKFESFENYEKSILGADVLKSYSEATIRGKRASADQALASALTKLGYDGQDYVKQSVTSGVAQQVAELLRTAAREGGNAGSLSKTAISRLATQPSNYAELKLRDHLPLGEDTVSAIFLPASGYWGTVSDARKRLANSFLSNVPAGTPAELLPESASDLYAALAEQLTEQTMKAGGRVPKSPYLSGLPVSTDWNEAYDAILSDIISSDKFASDVASMLTSRAK